MAPEDECGSEPSEQPLPGDEVVISGAAGKFAGCDGLHELRDCLFAKEARVSVKDSWKQLDHPDIPPFVGEMKNANKFDAVYFGIPYKLAVGMDIQSRLLLERAYEALVDAGLSPQLVKGTRMGVFVGASFSESEKTWVYERPHYGTGLTGCSRAMFANRISYWLDVKGPSYAVDTACSSSLYALQHAYHAIRTGECDSAIVGGVNTVRNPYLTLQFATLGILSKQGACRPFDEQADGYVRGEAVVAVVLQRARDARRVYAVVAHAGTNCDGFKEQGISHPLGAAQARLVRDCFRRCGRDRRRVQYVEAHTTATRVGDQVEVDMLDRVFCKEPQRDTPLLLGSIKANIGHGEPASGISSLAKVLIAIQEGRIPPTINLTELRRSLSGLTKGRLKVVTEPTPLTDGLICINNFGFGGANVHVILEPWSKQKQNGGAPSDPLPRLVLASGRSEEAVAALLGAAEKQQPPDAEFIRLLHDIHAADIPGHTHRGFCLAGGAGQPLPAAIERYPGQRRPVWFVFSGLGSQWPAMGKHLMNIPIFAETVRKIDAVLAPKGLDIQHILTSEDPTIFDTILNCFVGIATVHVGLVDILRAVGIEADGIVGHSMGELGCAYADGCLTAEQTLLAAYSRGRASLEATLIPGAMAAVGLGAAAVAPLCPPEVDVACHNGPDSATISGPAEVLRAFVKELQAKGVFAKEVACGNIAYHSRYIKPTEDFLIRSLREVIPEPRARSPRWVSSSVPESRWAAAEARLCSAAYQTNNQLNPVLFEEATRKLPSNAVAIEIAPHGLLQAILKRSLSPDCLNVALTKRGGDCVRTLLQALGRLYCAGLQPRPAALYPEVRYPVSRGTPMISPLVRWDHSQDWFVSDFDPKSQKESGERNVSVTAADPESLFMYGHVIDGRPLYPATGYLKLVWETLALMRERPFTETPVVFEDVKFLRATLLPKDASSTLDLTVMVHKGTGRFEVSEGRTALVTGVVRVPESAASELMGAQHQQGQHQQDQQQTPPLAASEVYKALRLRGYNYSGLFRGLVSASADGRRGRVRWDGNWVAFLDCLLQLKLMAMRTHALVVPTAIQKLVVDVAGHRHDGETSEVEAAYTGHLDLISTSAVEVRGLRANAISRRPPAGQPVLERYDFVAHSGAAPLELAAAVRACVQLALENGPPASRAAPPLHAVELLAPGAQPLAPLLLAALGDLPLVQARVSLLPESGAQPPPADALPPGVSVDADAALHTVRDAAFVLLADALAGERLRDCAPVLAAGGCVLSRESRAPGPRAAELARQAGLELAFCRPLQPGPEPGPAHSLALLRKGGWAADERSLTVVHVADCDSFPWLAQLQAALREPSPAPDKRVLLVAQGQPLSGVLGLFNCLRQEPGPGRQLVRCYALPSGPAFSPQLPLFRRQLQLDLAVNVYEAGGWGSYRHLLLPDAPPVQAQHAYCDIAVPGDLSSLRWLQGPIRLDPPLRRESEVLVHVYCSAVNFKDVMIASGKLNTQIFQNSDAQLSQIGLEFSGRTIDGKRVMGISAKGGSIANVVATSEHFIWDVPDNWSLEQAATVPVAYCTALQALEVQGRMRAGQSVLVHAGSGAVGQAAIHLALFRRCRVFATVGSADKRSFLLKRFPQLQPEDIGCSRDLSFERLVLERTAGRGVDLVLNSLAGDKLQASLRCLAEGGRFLEIGKADMAADSQIGMNMFMKQTSFIGVLLDKVWASDVETAEIHTLFSAVLKEGGVKPIASYSFDKEHVEQAYRYMAAGKHVGKVLIRVREREPQPGAAPPPLRLPARPRYHCDPSASYVICGGLGGFGLELADWLVGRGARALLLTSRRGVATGYQARKLLAWQARGVRVRVATDDASGADGSESILAQASALGPVDAIFNLAVVLQDALLENQTADKFREAYRCKAAATKQLDAASRRLCPRLRHFVVFSSVSCGRGNAGQTNYGLANAVMERVVRARHAAGLPATAVQWGAVGDVGLVADMRDDDKQLEIGGTLQQRISSCLEVLDGFLCQPHPVLASMVVAEKRAGAGSNDAVACVAEIFGMRDLASVSAETTLAELGLDSMMSVEIQQALERQFDILLTPKDVRGLTFARLAQLRGSQASASDSGAGPEHQEDPKTQLLGRTHDLLTRAGGAGARRPLQQLGAGAGAAAGPPVLMFPGIDGQPASLQALAQGLAAPAWGLGLDCVPDCVQSVGETVRALMTLIKQNQGESRRFKLLGYSFGGLLALEAAACLEDEGYAGHVILLDSSPSYIHSLLSALKPSGSEQEADDLHLERSITIHLIESTKTMSQEDLQEARARAAAASAWSQCRDLLLERALPAGADRAAAARALDGARSRLHAGAGYRWRRSRPLASRVSLVRARRPLLAPQEHRYGLAEMCQNIDVHCVAGNHYSMLFDKATTAIVNQLLLEE